ncbi:hypothetical protein [Sphaerisporangium sp. NPDC051011]|uniref:hypothetical protein n=1 Tax=Sphaerisporangium sp. NPDC051011 TaxID=3155792 RepID=UPI0033DAB93D
MNSPTTTATEAAMPAQLPTTGTAPFPILPYDMYAGLRVAVTTTNGKTWTGTVLHFVQPDEYVDQEAVILELSYKAHHGQVSSLIKLIPIDAIADVMQLTPRVDVAAARKQLGLSH